MIWQYKRDGGDLWRGLRRRGKRYNKRGGKNAGRGLTPVDHCRPQSPSGRLGGRYRCQCRTQGRLAHAGRAQTQLAKIIKLPRATAHATQTAGVRRLKPIGDFVHTITFDNGKEFAAHQDIAHALKAKISLATPLSRMGA
jgi:IS30 family transposase